MKTHVIARIVGFGMLVACSAPLASLSVDLGASNAQCVMALFCAVGCAAGALAVHASLSGPHRKCPRCGTFVAEGKIHD